MTTARPLNLAWSVSSDTTPDALDHYRHGMHDLYQVDVTPPSGRAFFNDSHITLFQAGAIGTGRSVRQTLSRDAGDIRRSGSDAISITLHRAPVVADCDNRSVSAPAGSIHVRDLARPAAACLDQVDLVSLLVPRERLSADFLALDLHGLALTPPSAAAFLLARHLESLAEIAPRLTEAEGEAAIEGVVLLLQGAVGEAPALASRPATDSLIHTVRQVADRIIEQRLLEPDLDAAVLAAACRVSRTTLYRAFEPSGGVARAIRDRRLDRARAVLAARTGLHPTVTEVAEAHGFVHHSHFSRLFRQRFGHPPSQTPLVGRGHEEAPHGAAPMRHDLLADWLRR